MACPSNPFWAFRIATSFANTFKGFPPQAGHLVMSQSYVTIKVLLTLCVFLISWNSLLPLPYDLLSGHTVGNNDALSPLQKKTAISYVSLPELVQPYAPISCPSGLDSVNMTINLVADRGQGRKIPKIVHMTGKTRCVTSDFHDAITEWKFENHSFYFHDEDAVDRMFDRDWPMFPQLKNALYCLRNAGGAAKADLWRYLALWEYGGIYTDMDNMPNTKFNSTTIPPEMDAFFLQERGGFLSQYFFAVSPRHPIMFFAVHDVLKQMHDLEDTGNFYVPVVTGPGALKRAFLSFMGTTSANADEMCAKYCKPPAGHYLGAVIPSRTINVFGSRGTSNEWVIRSAISGFAKRTGWKLMGITNYQAVNKQRNNQSCVMELFGYYN